MAPSRALSPVRPMSTLARMPSPLSSPTLRPSSPLGPRPTSNPFDTLQLPSPRNLHHSKASGNSNRRASNASLKLPSLPRFHPSNYSHSGQSPTQQTFESLSSNGPSSPRAHQPTLSDAQRQLFYHQREMVSAARAVPAASERPSSPRLGPLGSPGPVTPLELEAHEGYLTAGQRNSGREFHSEGQLVERLIRQEAVRRRQRSSQSFGDGLPVSDRVER